MMRGWATGFRSAIAGSILGAYATLVILAATCSFATLTQHGAHQHHAGQPSHSALCAWACQATGGDGLAALPVDFSVVESVEPSVPAMLARLQPTERSLSHPRAPPL